MFHAILVAIGSLALLLSAAWVREFRLRRGLQVLLTRFFRERGPQHDVLHDIPTAQGRASTIRNEAADVTRQVRRTGAFRAFDDPAFGHGHGRHDHLHRRVR